jgi:acid phosphatase
MSERQSPYEEALLHRRLHRIQLGFILTATLAALGLCTASSGSAADPPSGIAAQVAMLRQKIAHVIVIYQENWSFDGLYSKFPGANGANGAGTSQLQCPAGGSSYAPMTGLPPALSVAGRPTGPWPCGWQGLSGGLQDPNIPMGLEMKPYDLRRYDPPTMLTGDLWHIFWHEQLQLDNGNLEPSVLPMGKFAAYSSNPGLTFGYYDASNMPEGRLARRYTLLDNFFHSAFGGSYLNHIWLVCACTPQWNQPLPKNAPSFVSTWNPATHTLNDSNLTTMPRPGIPNSQLWNVNTTFTANSPHPPVPADQLLSPIPATQKTIGDLLTDHQPSISWKWYSGYWNLALKDPAKAGNCTFPSPTDPHPVQLGACFQFHHQPFAYFKRWGTDGSPEKAAHLQDEHNFLADLKAGTLPAVTFIKPVGVDNEHPVYATLAQGQRHVAELVKAVCDSKYWANTVVIITYDENGGRWDHVPPPKVDQWGPGTRVPAIIISPYARAHYVDHAQSESNSILALIEKRWDLPNLGSHDATANPLLEAFDFTQPPLACNAS